MRNDISRQCVILVGGLGTRLGSLTRNCPKPMLNVAGRPFVEHLIQHVGRFGFDDVILLAGCHGDIVASHFENWRALRSQTSVRVIIEPSPLGTAGALTLCRNLLAPTFLMINGDSLFDINILDLATRQHQRPWLARLALRQVRDASRFGTVETQPDGTVSAFRERPLQPGPGCINGGIYWLRRELVDRISTTPLSLERDVLPSVATEGLVCGWEYNGYFIDIGVPREFAEAQTALPKALQRPAVFFSCYSLLNQDNGYRHCIEDVRWIDGAPEAIKRCNDLGYFVFVVTNQSGVTGGDDSDRGIQRLCAAMNKQLRKRGSHIDDFRFCANRPDENVPSYAATRRSRKPHPSMLTDLMDAWPVDAKRSLLIGNKTSDIEAAAGSGLTGYLFHSGNLDQAVSEILQRLNGQ